MVKHYNENMPYKLIVESTCMAALFLPAQRVCARSARYSRPVSRLTATMHAVNNAVS